MQNHDLAAKLSDKSAEIIEKDQETQILKHRLEPSDQ